MNFFRKSKTPEDVARELLDVVFPADESRLAPPPEMRREVFIDEVRYLLTYVVDFACLTTLGEHPTREPLVEAFYDQLTKTLPRKTGDPRFLEHIRDRLARYAEAADEPRPEGLPAAVGTAFAAICNRPEDESLISFGAEVFYVNFAYTRNLLRRTHLQAPTGAEKK